MSPADGSGEPGHEHSDPAIRPPGGRTDTLLVEALIHLMIEKGLLTKNDALSIVETVAQVKRGALEEASASEAAAGIDLQMLRQMYESFEALAERPGHMQAEGGNIVSLRPAVHGDLPSFPED